MDAGPRDAGLKVIQDQVAQPHGLYHPWVADPPLPTWFHGTPAATPERWQTWTIAASRTPPRTIQRETLDGWFIDIRPT